MELTELYIKAGYPYDHFFIEINCKYLQVSVEKIVIL